MIRLFAGLLCLAWAGPALTRDNGQWAQNGDPEIGAWFTRQKQPDQPRTSCCGEADAYWADKIRVAHESSGVVHVFAVITDERNDFNLGRSSIAIGTEIEIPASKLKDTRSDPNPTGHAIIFVKSDGDEGWDVYCYIPNGGV